MQLSRLLAWTLLALFFAGCDLVDTVAETEAPMEEHLVMLSAYHDRSSKQLPKNIDLRIERERIIKEILSTHPELETEGTILPSLRGEAGWLIVALPAKYADIAPSVVQAYRLLDEEMRVYPARFAREFDR